MSDVSANDSAPPSTDAAPLVPARIQPHRVMRKLLAIACVPTLLSLFGRWHWIPDLASHFPVQSAAVMLPLLVYFLVRRDGWFAGVAAAVLVFDAVRIAPLYISPPQSKQSGPSLRVVSANVLTSNRDTARVLEFLEQEDPDVIVIMENNVRWTRELSVLKAKYPHSIAVPRPDNFGIAFYSKHPGRIEAIELGGAEVPTAVARLDVHGRPLTVIGLHTLPPISRTDFDDRNAQFRDLARLVRGEQNPVLILGDLNATSWTPHFRELVHKANLADSRRGFGLQRTWPADSFVLRIPIDHALTTAGIAVKNRRIGPDIGSDHLPIVVDLQFD